jgi:hypothetical protein
MTYTKTAWVEPQGSYLNRFKKQNVTDTSVELIQDPVLTNQPTPFDVENMNKMEQGIYDAHALLDTLFSGLGRVVIMRNINGDPTVMVRIPKFNLEDIHPDLGSGPHPAFVVNGVVKPEIYIGMFQAVIWNGCALSLPGQSPAVNINFDNAKAACAANGPGFHLMTNWEWAAIALWCLRNGFQPRGNNYDGKSLEATYETGTPAPDNAKKTLGGSGPASWRHDGTFSGIADLVGNIWEWNDGFKIVNGKIFMPADNDFNLVDANWPNLTGNQVVFPETAATDGGWRTMTTNFSSLADGVKKQLAQAMIVPNIVSGNTPLAIFDAAKGGFWIDPAGECFPLRGGYWYYGYPVGLAALRLIDPRSTVNGAFGFRPAFIL